ncbi:MAG: sensor domain-containing protein [Gammaproteobacteria bacterium]|nr:sensor domain-containing protein [Gammaproteobacteria bacterium]
MSNEHIDELMTAYLSDLKLALAGQDQALVQDALYDAEDHIRAALSESEDTPDVFANIVQSYGTAQEIAEYYCDMESTVNHALHGSKKPSTAIMKNRFFSVLTDGDAYRAMIYMVLAAPIGIVYFGWVAIFGLGSLSASLLIIGIPFFLIFLKSMELFSLFEGRLIEMLLGQRMPRRPRYQKHVQYDNKLQGWLSAIGDLLKRRRIWTTIIYLGLQAWLGLIYFMTLVTGAILSIVVFISPIVDPILHAINPANTIDIDWYWFPIAMPGSFITFVIILHLAKIIGNQQAKFARYLLVGVEIK